MKGLIYEGRPVPLYREDLPMPVPGPEESLIRVKLAGICNTDREVLKGYRPDFKGVMGHEFTGVVEQSSDPTWVGKRVVGELNAGCGHCIYCRTGREKHCLNRKVIGMDGKDGCFAEYMTLATHLLHEIPEGLSDEEAVFTEPLAAALEIPKQIPIDPDQEIGIIGDGRLAYLAASVLHLSGAGMTIVGKHEEKLEVFRRFGKVTTKPEGSYELIIEASGSPTGLETAMDLVRKQGTIVLKSTYAGKTAVDMSFFAVNEVTLTGSRCGPFKPALNLLKKGLVQLPGIQLYELKDFEKAFASKAFKAGFRIG